MSGSKDDPDLTRWNRSGESRFRYVDGNAITYLETLRQAMRSAYSEAGVNQWGALDTAIPELAGETAAERQARWKRQYYDQRRDYAWEILRSYARAGHVLTEHLDAYANESYLGTATQWENVRRLVGILDYHPAPPASAQALVALLAKPGRSGTVATGFGFKNQPLDGPPVKFETLDDLAVDADLNQLKAAAWDQSQQTLVFGSGVQNIDFPLAAPLEGVSVGSPGVLLAALETGGEGSEVGVAVAVSRVAADAVGLHAVARPAGFPARAGYHQLRLLLNPAHKAAPRISGTQVLTLDSAGHGLSVRSVIAWNSGGGWQVARVTAVNGQRVQLSGPLPETPESGDALYLMVSAKATRLSGVDAPKKRVVLPLQRQTDDLWDAALTKIGASKVEQQPASKADGTQLAPMYDFLNGSDYPDAYYVVKADPVAKVVAAAEPPAFDGDPGKLATDDWVVADNGSSLQAARVVSLSEADDGYQLQLAPSPTGMVLLFSEFSINVRPRGHNINSGAVFETDPALRAVDSSVIPLATAELPSSLTAGRRLIIAGKDEAMAVTVKSVDKVVGTAITRVRVAPAIPGSELGGAGSSTSYTRHGTIIYANVVAAGHGETQKQSILGSGDATSSHQAFTLDEPALSYITDGGFPTGVRADVALSVDGRRWRQVASLQDSGAEDPHYTVRLLEDGGLQIAFGDGVHGRRLPSGNNNVRLLYRKGNGLAGNLEPYSLNKAIKPHALVDAVVQPVATSGGNDREAVDSLRRNAPAGVMALERAVSLADFTHLATTNSGVWQARAFRRQAGHSRSERIEVVVVPAGGGILGSLKDSLEAHLGEHALPGVKVSVAPYAGLLLDLEIALRINQLEYLPESVINAVEQALYNAFSLHQARLGETLYRSQVTAVVEAVTGVASSVCSLQTRPLHTGGVPYRKQRPTPPASTVGPAERVLVERVRVAGNQAVYLQQGLSRLVITAQATR